jgi:pyridinium-3,5-biscarboxylic acid mononucleotide sulfurtransferase
MLEDEQFRQDSFILHHLCHIMIQSTMVRSGIIRPWEVASRSYVKLTKTPSTTQSNSGRFEEDASALVDNLMQRTQALMQGYEHHLVAFSGGVDSSLVLALLRLASTSSQRVQPVLGISPAVPQEQVRLARQVSSHLGFALTEIQTEEGADEIYIANEGKACLACKTHLYTSLKLVLDHSSQQIGGALYNGTNADDTQDPTRVGLIAASNFRVLSPLEHTPKSDVRRAAKFLGLPNWDFAASPCLRSRLALGVEATQRHLRMIEDAENLVKETLSGYNETSNLRVRMLTNQRARVEVDNELTKEAIDQLPLWTAAFQKLGFSDVHVKDFKSGSVSVALNEASRALDQ